MLETGEVDALIVQNPYAMGYLGVESAYNLLNEIPIKGKQVDTETICATRENMYDDEYQKHCSHLSKFDKNRKKSYKKNK